MSIRKRKLRRKAPRILQWAEKIIALIALANLGLVLFDLTYISWRDLYLRYVPQVTRWYDPYKGIEPNRSTTFYIEQVNELKMLVAEGGLRSPAVADQLMRLQDLSIAMIDENPFEAANKTGSLEKIKNRMRERLKTDSAKDAFRDFWSAEHLSRKGWIEEIQFFDQKIQPTIAANYFRNIGESGDYVSYFWQIDQWFMLIFAIDILLRTLAIHRRYPSLKLQEAVLWRWYDIPLILPFWQWLRVLPVVIRLGEAELIDAETVRSQFSRGFVASFAEELIEVIAIQILSQLQASIKTGDTLKDAIAGMRSEYVDINNTNELQEIIKRLLRVTTCQVLPQIQPDIKALVHHNVETALEKSQAYQVMQRIPGLVGFPKQLAEQVSNQVSRVVSQTPKSAYTAVAEMPEDPIANKLTDRLVERFISTFSQELERQQTMQEIQGLLVDLIEEIKVNYIRQLTQEDFDRILEENRQLQQKVDC